MTTRAKLSPGLFGNATLDEQELTKYLDRPTVLVLPILLGAPRWQMCVFMTKT